MDLRAVLFVDEGSGGGIVAALPLGLYFLFRHALRCCWRALRWRLVAARALRCFLVNDNPEYQPPFLESDGGVYSKPLPYGLVKVIGSIADALPACAAIAIIMASVARLLPVLFIV